MRVQSRLIPTNFTEPKFVQAIEARPSDRSVVHHVLINYQAKPDMTRTPVLAFNRELQRIPPPTFGENRTRRNPDMPARLIAVYAPGSSAQVYRPGTALRLEAGGVIELQLHLPRYDFNWQTYYMFKDPLHVPKGAKLLSTAAYDNSPGNKDNRTRKRT